MADLTGGSVLRRRADVRYRVIDGEAVIVRQSAAEVMVLNEIGARILDLADGTTPISQWVRTLLSEYEADEAALSLDILAFAGELVDSGVLEEGIPHGL